MFSASQSGGEAVKEPFSCAAIIGVGMLGGSLGKALLERGLAKEVVGYDRDKNVLDKALTLGAVTQGTLSLEEAVKKSDLVILAAPVMATLKLLPQIAPLLAAGTIVTDVCSTKKNIMVEALKVLPPTVAFVGGHPMAGSEKDGVEALDANLFENAIYVITSPYQDALARIKQLVQNLGAIPAEFPPDKHDELVAAVSHLPHLAATALVNAVAGMKETSELQLLAAGGFRDTTRIAMGSPQMWRDICLTNGDPICVMLDKLIKELQTLRRLVAEGDGEQLYTQFAQARQFRQNIPARDKGILPQIYNLFVYVPDHPGVIGEIAGLLGKNGINIAEIELLRVREEKGGPLRFGFKSRENLHLAASCLAAEGYRVEMQEE